eukprot:2137309-Amphidinium_carterae.1
MPDVFMTACLVACHGKDACVIGKAEEVWATVALASDGVSTHFLCVLCLSSRGANKLAGHGRNGIASTSRRSAGCE